MTRFIFALAAALLVPTIRAEEPQTNIKRLSADTSVPAPISVQSQYGAQQQIAVTPEMWFYEQEQRRLDDPRTAIRAKAALETAQRQQRIAAMRWYGLSNSLPIASTDPLHGVYSPRWTSSGYNPSDWLGPSTATILYVPTTSQ